MTIAVMPFSPIWAARADLIYDGNLVQKTDLLNLKGVEYLPLKTAAGMFKGKTQWFPIAGKVIFQLRNHKISFQSEKRQAEIGSRKITLNAPVRLIGGTIYVPVHFFLSEDFTEIADCKVTWDSENLILHAEPSVTLFSPRILTRTASTRLTFESTEPLSPSFKLKGSKLSIELPKARIADDETVRVKDALIQNVSLSKARKGVVVQVTLANGVTAYQSFTEENPNRLILDFRNPKAGEETAEEEAWVREIPPEPPQAPEIKTEEPMKKAKEKPKASAQIRNSVRKIVVDAGHGGEDTGAIGREGTKEKDINLMIALELARQLRLEGFEVFMTRVDDVFIPLQDRSLLANGEKADVFVSIHCNASPFKRHEGGFEIYFLSENATDQHAEDIARFENLEPEFRGSKESLKKKLTEVLFSMARTEFINESSLLGHMISKGVDRRVPIDNRGVKQADFHVLHGAQMPSVLVEAAFIDYPKDEKKLRQRKFRSAMVDAIITGIQNYESKLALLNR